MKLSEEKLFELAKNAKGSSQVEEGRRYESRLRLFTEPKFEEDIKDEYAWKEFKKFMVNALSADKEVRISSFIQYPLSAVNITESLLSDLYKVFDAGNSYFSIETVSKGNGKGLMNIFNNININSWMEEVGKRVLRNKPNTVVVIDKDENGLPYLLEVDNDRLIDIQLRQDGVRCEYIVFIHSKVINENDKEELRIAIYDDENYNVILSLDGNFTLESCTKHTSNVCPARMFLDEKLNSSSDFSRKSPLALALSKIQEWQYFDLYKFYTDHYAPFPVTEMLRAKCGVSNCVNGIITVEDQYFEDGVSKMKYRSSECNVCKSNNQVGVGAKILLEPTEEGEASASGKFRMISHDVNNLKYLQEKLDSIEDYIKLKVVGVDNATTKEAVNEKQVKGSFESRTNVLLGIKTNLDSLYEWIAYTIASIKGASKISVSANFGTEWYLISEDELQDKFKKANEMGIPKEEVNQIYFQLLETKYKGNIEKIERLKLISAINPCLFDSLDTKMKKFSLGLISDNELIISERLSIFVQRFEMENVSIVEFGSELERSKKIEKILIIINKYADEYRKKNPSKQIGSSEKTDEQVH